MLDTIEKCNAELDRLDLELERLRLARRRVKATVTLLTEIEGKRVNRSSPLTHQVYEIVKDNPGISGQGIKVQLRTRFEAVHTTKQISSALAGLSRKQPNGTQEARIENRGGRGLAAQWYVIEDHYDGDRRLR